ncbi:MAG: dNTP triphosphohydrolase [Leptospiraceae bacterium]|nr:dNTP triphosphohydrolase [Leptospiraceae bacterium]MDW7975812.1 dNTP triphosphohydrolase [Leptospiraceae bacterium]
MKIEEFEDQFLAPYALKNTLHEGRFYQEQEDPYRTNFQRDRDRIIHSKAFRRLGYKTQVFVNNKGDSFRTRLTHSIEVSQLSRSISGMLKLNKDYAEAIALAHDIGHPPFGHQGESILDKIMENHNGFEHNKQNLRIVTVLEDRYPYCRGLNLSKATIKGLMKYNKIYEEDTHLKELFEEKKNQFPPLEWVIVDTCDRIAYLHHDLEDGIDSGYLILDQVLELEYWKNIYHYLEKEWNTKFTKARTSYKVRMMIRHSLNLFIRDFVETSKKNLDSLQLGSIQDVYSLQKKQNPVRNSDEFRHISDTIFEFLKKNLYYHPEIALMERKAEKILKLLFEEFLNHPKMLPIQYQEKILEFGIHRVVCDYISGMTDRYAIKLYKELR